MTRTLPYRYLLDLIRSKLPSRPQHFMRDNLNGKAYVQIHSGLQHLYNVDPLVFVGFFLTTSHVAQATFRQKTIQYKGQ
jgi:hypothetical protein